MSYVETDEVKYEFQKDKENNDDENNNENNDDDNNDEESILTKKIIESKSMFNISTQIIYFIIILLIRAIYKQNSNNIYKDVRNYIQLVNNYAVFEIMSDLFKKIFNIDLKNIILPVIFKSNFKIH